MDVETLRTLPFEGSRLRELVFCGNGKDSEVSLKVDGFPPIIIPLSRARMDLTFATELLVETSADGDTAITIRVNPPPDQTIILERAQLDFPGSEDDWHEELEGYRKSNGRRAVGGWAVSNLILRLNRAA
jgi:hypothetical protein